MKNAVLATKIKGGFAGYKIAADDGYRSRIMNPVLRWSESEGFFVEPECYDPPADGITIGTISYDANTGNRHEGSRTQYGEARTKILHKYYNEY